MFLAQVDDGFVVGRFCFLSGGDRVGELVELLNVDILGGGIKFVVGMSLGRS